MIAGVLSCEEQKRVIQPFVPSGTRVVLLEEFTGKGCNNCPKGSREIENLLTLFPDNLIAVSIHAGNFANPLFFPYGQYDLRAPQSAELLDLLKTISFYPTASVNRTIVNGNIQLGLNQWASVISSELESAPAVDLSLEKSFNPASRELSVTVSGIGKQSVSGALKLSVMLTESGIIDAQDDNEAGGLVSDYVHRHVLRDMMTPTAGETLFSSIATGETFSRTYTKTLDAGWNADNMEIIAFITNEQGASMPVLQAISQHVTD